MDAADEDALWRDAALADDVGPRLVLADHLLQTGQRRGELITLQCSDAPDAAERARQLVDAYWDRWLGDLGRVLDRGGTQFAHGLLHAITVGHAHAPPWAYARVATDRELWSVRVIRPSWHLEPEAYVDLLARMPHLPPDVTLGSAMVPALVRARPRWPIRALAYAPDFYRRRDRGVDGAPPLTPAVAQAAGVLPDVEEIRLASDDAPLGELTELAAALPALFPRLARIMIDARFVRILTEQQADALAVLRALPLVHVERGAPA